MRAARPALLVGGALAVVLLAAGCARQRDAGPAARSSRDGGPAIGGPTRIGAYLTFGRVRMMTKGGEFTTYASAIFVDSTRGIPEAGYWRVPAGLVTLTGAGRRVTLHAERSVVSGVEYSAPPESLAYVPGARYVFAASGGDTVGALRASVTAPVPPRLLAPAADAVVSRARDLVIRWTPGSPRDSIEIEVEPHSPSGYPRLTYRVADTGRLTVLRAALEEFPSDYVTMITATRRARADVAARGVRAGRLEASAVDFVHVRLARRAAS